MSSSTLTFYYEPKEAGTAVEYDGMFFVISDGAYCDDYVGQILEASEFDPETGRATLELDDAAEVFVALLKICVTLRHCNMRPVRLVK